MEMATVLTVETEYKLQSFPTGTIPKGEKVMV